MYDKNKHLCHEGKSKEFFDILENDEDARSALVSIFNYLEIMALGIEQKILDEDFLKSGFKTMFIHYRNDYKFYIDYRRNVHKTPKSWEEFTELAEKWSKEN